MRESLAWLLRLRLTEDTTNMTRRRRLGHLEPESVGDHHEHALSAVAGTVAANYQTCHENAEQLRALQAWVKEMGRAITPAPQTTSSSRRWHHPP